MIVEAEDEDGDVFPLVASRKRLDGGDRERDRGFFNDAVVGPIVFAGDGAEDFGDERAAVVGVGHHDGTTAGAGVEHERAAEAGVGAGVGELEGVIGALDAEPEAVIGVGERRGDHRGGGSTSEEGRLAIEGGAEREGEAGEIGGCGPEARGGLLGVDVGTAGDERAVGAVASGGARRERGGERLLKRGGGHAGRGEDASAEERVEGFSGYVEGELLGDRVAAAGVAPLGAGTEVEADGGGIGGWSAVEDLEEAGARGVGGVADEAVDGEAGRVAEETAERDGFGGGKGGGG